MTCDRLQYYNISHQGRGLKRMASSPFEVQSTQNEYQQRMQQNNIGDPVKSYSD